MTATALYRFYDASNALLYVGITNNLPGRLAEHARDKPWFVDVTRVDVGHHADRQGAADAERLAIANELPRHNVRGKTAVVVAHPPHRSPGEFPVDVGDVVALARLDGSCPVGLVDWVGAAGVRLLLVSWMTGAFGVDVRLVPWDAIADIRWARLKWSEDGSVYDLDPLADFQDAHKAATS